MPPLLEARDVTKSFSQSVDREDLARMQGAAVNGVSLEVAEGGSLGIAGGSGAGKTTLAQLLAGALEPDVGQVRFDGEQIGPGRDRKLLALQMQMIWQDSYGSLDPRYKVKKCIAEPLEIHKKRENVGAEVAKLMEEVGLSSSLARRYPHEISGGEIQRVVIARALALDPRLLICDEPASALDTLNKRRIIKLLARLRRERGLTYIIISHDLPAVSELVDNLMIMHDGEVVESGEAIKVLRNPLHPYTRKLISAVPMMPRRSVAESV